MTHHACRHPALKRLLVLQLERLDARLAFRACFPTGLRAFVAADVKIDGWEHLHDLVDDSLVICKRFLVSGADDVFADSPDVPWLPLQVAGARELGMSSEKRAAVSWNLYLGNDLDAALRCIQDNLRNIFRRVEKRAVGLAVAFLFVSGKRRRGARGAIFHELGESGHVKTPALVVGEMPMEPVQTKAMHVVKIILDRLLAEEMSCLVKVETSPGIAFRPCREGQCKHKRCTCQYIFLFCFHKNFKL